MNNEYYQALKYIYLMGDVVQSRGFECREKLFQSITLKNPRERISTLNPLSTNINYAMTELRWYLSGSDRIDFNPLINKTWSRFSDDGVHANSAYGIRIFGKHPIISTNQFQWVIDKLREDSGTRQAIININSWFDKKPTLDFPCCIYSHYFIRDNKLHNFVSFRSSDINLGWKNDVFCFTSLQEIIATILNVELGQFKLTSNSLHIYSHDYDRVYRVLMDYHNSNLINTEYDINVNKLIKDFQLK